MQAKYLIRLDDACPTMDKIKWFRMESLLDKYNIKPMVGLIPNNQDPKMMIYPEDMTFYEKKGVIDRWKKKEWSFALHGFNHTYTSFNGLQGINPVWKKSEYAGLSLEEQRFKIRAGLSILKEKGITPRYFFAPSHTFDENTLQALKLESEIRVISDTIARKPYKSNGFVFIPQISGHCCEMPISGVWTFCFHPNTMKDTDFVNAEEFFSKHKNEFISFEDINIYNIKEKDLVSKLMSWAYFSYRKICRFY
ncbi:DUF2334 domain-containing protein [Parabacteroides timonensis]|uniref:DUF2334 domain-containing protein n=1 Tax=Parabacteroides timonensis TaxID=1871013 RepID=UPI00094E979F|nr:DUF2334 domain-containing protein [Parabacteroides timonensis]